MRLVIWGWSDVVSANWVLIPLIVHPFSHVLLLSASRLCKRPDALLSLLSHSTYLQQTQTHLINVTWSTPRLQISNVMHGRMWTDSQDEFHRHTDARYNVHVYCMCIRKWEDRLWARKCPENQRKMPPKEISNSPTDSSCRPGPNDASLVPIARGILLFFRLKRNVRGT